MSTADTAVQRILEERAAKFAARRVAVEGSAGHELVVVRIGNEQFGIPARAVERVIAKRQVLTLPGAQPWLVGVAMHRDVPISLLDLRPLLGEPAGTNSNIVAIVRGVLGEVGLVADGLVGLREVRDDELVEIPKADRFARTMTPGMTRIVDPDALTLDPRVRGGLARDDVEETE